MVDEIIRNEQPVAGDAGDNTRDAKNEGHLPQIMMLYERWILVKGESDR